MPTFLADENFHGDVVRGLRRREPDLDIVRVQDVGLTAGLPMPGVLEVKRSLAVGQAIEDILFIVAASQENEWEGQVRYLPL